MFLKEFDFQSEYYRSHFIAEDLNRDVLLLLIPNRVCDDFP